MKRRISVILAAALILVTAFAVAGCGGEPKTLENYMNDNPAAQEEVSESLAGLQNDDMDVAVSYSGNKVIITCEMKTTYEKNVLKTIKKTYAKSAKKLDEPMMEAVAGIESETGLSGVTIEVVINNGDGSEIWKGIYPEEEEPSEESQSESQTEAGSETEQQEASSETETK